MAIRRTATSAVGRSLLPENRSVVRSKITDYSALWYGQKKIGKTCLAAQFPDACFLATEPGHKAVSVFKIDTPDWPTFTKASTELIRSKRFSTVVIDIVDNAYLMCMDHVCRKEGVEYPSDNEDFGRAWRKLRDEFYSALMRLQNAKHLICISHAQTKMLKARGGATTSQITSSMSGQCSNIVEAVIDIWLYFNYASDKDGHSRRVIHTQGDGLVSAGGRPTNLPRLIDMGGSAEEAFENLSEAWEGRSGAVTFEELFAQSKPRRSVRKVSKKRAR